jgi:hypothetical protein
LELVSSFSYQMIVMAVYDYVRVSTVSQAQGGYVAEQGFLVLNAIIDKENISNSHLMPSLT